MRGKEREKGEKKVGYEKARLGEVNKSPSGKHEATNTPDDSQIFLTK